MAITRDGWTSSNGASRERVSALDGRPIIRPKIRRIISDEENEKTLMPEPRRESKDASSVGRSPTSFGSREEPAIRSPVVEVESISSSNAARSPGRKLSGQVRNETPPLEDFTVARRVASRPAHLASPFL